MNESLEVEAGKGANNVSVNAPISSSSQSNLKLHYDAILTRERVDEVVEGSHPGYCFLRYVLNERCKKNESGEGLRKILDGYHCSPGLDCCCCALKNVLLEKTDIKDRSFVQMKAVELVKYTREVSLGKEIGWARAWDIWFDEGFYERFRGAYSPGKPAVQIFRETIPDNPVEAEIKVQQKDPEIYNFVHPHAVAVA